MSVSRSVFFRVCLPLFFMGAAIFVGLRGVLLLVESIDSHGSFWGKVFLFGLGLVLLGLSPFVFMVGLINRKQADPAQTDTDG
jgi:hypothetical protein